MNSSFQQVAHEHCHLSDQVLETVCSLRMTGSILRGCCTDGIHGATALKGQINTFTLPELAF